MSSGTVRASFRSALEAAFPAVQYVETIAVRVDNLNLDPLWHTIEFVPERDAPIGLGRPTCWREFGIARIWVGAKTGQGDGVAVAHADAVLAQFRNFKVPAEKLRVMEVSPPFTAPESDGRWILASIDLRYQRDYMA